MFCDIQFTDVRNNDKAIKINDKDRVTFLEIMKLYCLLAFGGVATMNDEKRRSY